MHILSIALGGCLRGEPVCYGITEDTGGHITYILGEMRALARHPDVSCAEIVTRLFDEPELGAIHSVAREQLEPGCFITRIDSGNRRYLAKDELRADRAGFIAALIAELKTRERLPDLIHAHFADAADVAAHVQRALGIPYIYTAHSLGMDKVEAIGTPCKALNDRIREEDRAIAHAAAVVGSSRDECERQLLAYPSAKVGNIHRVLPGISIAPQSHSDANLAERLIAPFLRDLSKPLILAVARPVHKKNLAKLVEAFVPLRERANLVILAGQRSASDHGEAEQVEVVTGLLHLIDSHDLYGSVAYPKTHTSADVAALYTYAARSGGVFANTALIEPYGLTLLEAAAHGLPVVATNVGGPADTIAHLEHGLLIDPRDVTGISNALSTLLDDQTLWSKCSANGVSNSRAISWTQYARSFVDIAKQVIANASPMEHASDAKATSLFVSDLDNTLTGCRGGVEQLRVFLSENPEIAFVIATGRSLTEARRIVREWGIPQPVAWITSVGSEIYWPTRGGIDRDQTFPNAPRDHWQVGAVDAVMSGLPLLKPQPHFDQREYKRSYFYSDTAEIDAVREAFLFSDLQVRVIPSHQRLLDILPLTAGKAAAMQHVAAVLGIEPECIFAAGDSGNDEDMLMTCENAIIVRNHSAEIASLASRSNVYVSRRAHASGAIEGIEEHRLRQSNNPVAHLSGVAL